MAQDQHNLTQDEKFKRMTATNKAVREQKESKPPKKSEKVHIPPEDIEAMRELMPIALTNEPLPERNVERDYSEPEEVRRRREYPDSWERLTDWAKDYREDFRNANLVSKLWMLLVALFYILLMPIGIKIVVELTAPRTTLSYFHTYMIAAGIVAIFVLYAWWGHKSKHQIKSNE